MVWSKFTDDREVSGNHNRYSQRWFWWTNKLPQPVADVLVEASERATNELVDLRALPTFWPAGLLEQDQQFPFDIKIESFCVYNPDYDKDKLNEANFRITSPIHYKDGRYEETKVHFNLDYGLEQRIFKALDEHM